MILKNDIEVFWRFRFLFTEQFENFWIGIVSNFPRAVRQACYLRCTFEDYCAHRFLGVVIGKLNHPLGRAAAKMRKRKKQKRNTVLWETPRHRKCDIGCAAFVQTTVCDW